MTHAIYFYLLISAILFGYRLGDQFNKQSLIKNMIYSVLWTLHLAYCIGCAIVEIILSYDIVVLTLTLLFGYNPYKNNESKKAILEYVGGKHIPRWQKTRTGRYKIRGFEKLKKLNNC